MLQRVGECGAVTTKMLSHGPRSHRPSLWCEVCEASGAAATYDWDDEKKKRKKKISNRIQSRAADVAPKYKSKVR